MKALLSWMQEFAPIEGEPAFLAETMTDLGMVVESVDESGPAWDGIIVAKVLGLRPHPEADRIQLVDVDTGDGEALQICCGAFNMAVGDLVPLATLGTVMPGGLEIARRKLRGEWSNGMLCSSVELELAADDDEAAADGIMVLDKALPLGQDIASALGSESDVVFDLDIEGNRPDALSIAGITRDLAARLGVPFTHRTPTFSEVEPAASTRASVRIDAPELCPRFGLRVLDNITMGESPSWMVSRLVASGMRPINAIVDISNYVMLELGQPNHTYDLDLVPDGVLGVRMGRDGEQLTTLDDVERTITEADGLIVNGRDEPIGLAGVMGGASTEISDTTTRVVVEAAVWDRMTIAKTSRRLGLRSEASTRFERGADPMGIERALDRFVELAAEICGAKVSTGAVVAEGAVAAPTTVGLRTARANRILNTTLTTADIEELLAPIGFATERTDDDTMSVTIPSWRPDASLEIDVIEEVGRHHGYSKSGKRVPTPTQAGGLTADQHGRRRLRRAFLGCGLAEAMPMPFLAPGDLADAGLSPDAITLSNPLVAEESVLRTSMLPGLLKALVRNQSHRMNRVGLYELGRVYRPSEPTESDPLPDEFEMVAAIGSGYDADAAPGETAAEAAVRTLYRIGAELGLDGMTIANADLPGLHPTRGAVVRFRGRDIGEVGEVDPSVLERYGVSGRVSWIQLRTEPIIVALRSARKYKAISLYPSSDIDLAFATPDDVAATDVARTLKSTGKDLLRSVELFDVFRGSQLGDGRRSLAFQLRFQADDRTLTDAEVAEIRQACIDAVAKKHGAELR